VIKAKKKTKSIRCKCLRPEEREDNAIPGRAKHRILKRVHASQRKVTNFGGEKKGETGKGNVDMARTLSK